jgi:hypothetical protein
MLMSRCRREGNVRYSSYNTVRVLSNGGGGVPQLGRMAEN